MKKGTKITIKNAALGLAFLAISISALVVCTNLAINNTLSTAVSEKETNLGGLTVSKGAENGLKVSTYSADTTLTSSKEKMYVVEVKSDPEFMIEHLTFTSTFRWKYTGNDDVIGDYLSAAEFEKGKFLVVCKQAFPFTAELTISDQNDHSVTVDFDYEMPIISFTERWTCWDGRSSVDPMNVYDGNVELAYYINYGIGSQQPTTLPISTEGSTAYFQRSFIEEFYAVAQDNYDEIVWTETVSAPTLPDGAFQIGGFCGTELWAMCSITFPGERVNGVYTYSVADYIPGYAEMNEEMKRAAAIGFLSALSGTVYDGEGEEVSAPICLCVQQDFSHLQTGGLTQEDAERKAYGINFDITCFAEYKTFMNELTISSNTSSIVF